MGRLRILIADDHTLLVEAFVKLLEPKYEVVGTAEDGRALLTEAQRLKPDIILADISMPRLNGLDAAHQIKQTWPEAKLIFLTVNEDPGLVAEAFRMGASGYLLKNCAASELFRAIQQVSLGRAYVTPMVAQGMLESFVQDPQGREVSKLTTRQREILQLLAEGNSMKQVAAVLNVAPRTVAFHKYRIMKRLGLTNNAELIQLAIREGMVN
jgi:DNA-binding NarL/FixJ family response regulator